MRSWEGHQTLGTGFQSSLEDVARQESKSACTLCEREDENWRCGFHSYEQFMG
jgi:hypothetical protein